MDVRVGLEEGKKEAEKQEAKGKKPSMFGKEYEYTVSFWHGVEGKEQRLIKVAGGTDQGAGFGKTPTVVIAAYRLLAARRGQSESVW